MDEHATEVRDRYMRDLASALRKLPVEARREIIDELRAHIDDAYDAGGGGGPEAMAAVLDRMGSPRLVARSYLAEVYLDEGAHSFSPGKIGRGLVQAVGAGFGLSFVGGAFIGIYAVPLVLLVAGIGKVLAPGSGLFVHDNGWVLSLHAQPGATEVLGWWLVPLGIGGGLLGFVGATLLLRIVLRHRATLSQQVRRFVRPGP